MVLTNSHYCFFRMTKLMKYKTSKAHAFSKFSNFLYQWYFFNEKLCQLNLWKCHIYFINFYDSSSCMTVLRNYQRILTVLEINHVFFLSKMTWFSWFIMELEYQMCPEPAIYSLWNQLLPVHAQFKKCELEITRRKAIPRK